MTYMYLPGRLTNSGLSTEVLVTLRWRSHNVFDRLTYVLLTYLLTDSSNYVYG